MIRQVTDRSIWREISPYDRGTLLHLCYHRPCLPDTWKALAREIREAHKRLLWARAVATRTNDSDVRIHYIETWLRSLMTVARNLP